MLDSRSNNEGRTVRVLAVLAMEPCRELGLAGSGRHPAGSETSEVGREDAAMEVGREDAGGVGGMMWKDDRWFVPSRMRSS